MFTQEEVLELQFIAQAIYDLAGSDCSWELPKPDFDSLVWKTESVEAPTRSAVEARIEVLRKEWVRNTYKRNRSAEYPSYADQLDMIFHHGVDYWKEQIQAVKDKHPKP